MTVHIHNESEPGWTQHLADILDSAEDGDILVVSSYAVLDLAQNALRRRSDHKYLRIMTRETYARLEEQAE